MKIFLSILGGIFLAIMVIGAFSNRQSYGWENEYFSSAGDKIRQKVKKKNAKNQKAN
jgi:hypothetical protein